MRVRMTLHEKGIPFETKEEDLKNFSNELQKLHPEAKVPVLVHKDVALYESSIITEYIEDYFPTPSLMPSKAYGRAQLRLLTYWCNQIFKPHVDAFKYGEFRCSPEEAKLAPQNIRNDLTKLEAHLANSDFLLGESISLADIHIFPFVRQFSRSEGAQEVIKDFPRTSTWLEKILARPSFERTIEKKKPV